MHRRSQLAKPVSPIHAVPTGERQAEEQAQVRPEHAAIDDMHHLEGA
jgi:hypothetical protein